MKIIYVEANPGNGGAEEYAINLANQAVRAGHEVLFVLGLEKGQMVERVRDNHFDMMIIPMQSSFNPLAVFSSILKLRKFINEQKPDIVHTQMLREQSLVIGAKLFGAKTKLIRTFHRLDQFNSKMKPLLPIYRKFTDAFIAPSEYAKDYLTENGIIKRVYVVHNGVAEVVTQRKDKALGFLGRLSVEKRIKEFVTANSSMFPNTKLRIGGDGPEKIDIESFVNKKNLNIEILGQITDKNMFFSLFNVLILPSYTEALPLVVLEAFSAGTPVVAFDIPPLRGLITQENGALVKNGDFKQLAKVATEISESKVYKKFSEKARETYLRGYTIEKMWFDTSRLYEHLSRKG